MNTDKFPEIKPKVRFIKKIYLTVMLWVVGHAIQAAAKVDREVKAEFASLRDDFIVKLSIMPDGPAMIVGKDKKGIVKYMGWNDKGEKVTLDMKIKNISSAILVFTFQEGTCEAFCNNRFIVSGDLPDAVTFVRILNIIEIYLLPEFIAKLAVKRYPKWSQMNPVRKHFGRVLIYIRAFTI